MKLGSKIEATIEIPNTSYPRERVEGGYVSVDDTLNPLGDSAFQAGYNAVIVLTKHKGWWQRDNPRGTYFNSWEKMGWSFVWFYPAVIDEAKFYKELLPLSHELTHQVLYATIDPRNMMLDEPPYRTETEITEVLFEGKYPLQWF